MAQAHCMLDTEVYKYTYKLCTIHSFSTATMFARTLLNIVLCLHYLSCIILKHIPLLFFTVFYFFILRPGPNEWAGQSGSCSRTITYKGHCNVSEIMGNTVLVNSAFHAQNISLKSIHTSYTRSPECSSALLQTKKVKEYRFEGAPNH
jgi:hypothetical protein